METHDSIPPDSVQKITFLGLIFPKSISISLSCPTINWKEQERNRMWEFDIKVENNKVTINCKVDNYSLADLEEAYRRALDLVKMAVNLSAFANGIGFQVILEKFIDHQGIETELQIRDESLVGLCKVINPNMPSSYGDIFNIVALEPAIFFVLNDLITAITVPHESVITCARAVEGIRHLIAPNKSKEDQWNEMRLVLLIDRSYLKMIMDNSLSSRHGNRNRIDGVATTEIVKRSWVIMDRFLEYRKRDNTRLPESEFQILK